MSRDDDGPEEDQEGGLEGAALVESAWKAFAHARAALGMETPDWGDLDEEYLTPFAAAVSTARDVLLDSEESPRPTSQVVDEALAAFFAASHSAQTPQDAAHLDRVAFEAVVRHVLNAMEYDPEEHGRISDHEENWGPWAARKKEEIDGNSQVAQA